MIWGQILDVKLMSDVKFQAVDNFFNFALELGGLWAGIGVFKMVIAHDSCQVDPDLYKKIGF